MVKVAFLFDMDGVIVDSNPYHKLSLQQFCKQHGHNLSEDELKEKIYGRTNKDWLKNLFGNLDSSVLKQYANQKEALFRKLYDKDIKPVDGLLDFLHLMDNQQISRAIATSAPRENVDFTLEKTHTGKFFKTILDESFVEKGKPNPEIYLKSAAALGFDAANCIVFEDSLSGVQAGKAAGCKVVGLSTTHTAEELKDTDLVIKDFVGLDPQKLIEQLF